MIDLSVPSPVEQRKPVEIETEKDLYALINNALDLKLFFNDKSLVVSFCTVAVFEFMARRLRLSKFWRQSAIRYVEQRLNDAPDGHTVLIHRNLLFPDKLTPSHFPTAAHLVWQYRHSLARIAEQLENESSDPGVRRRCQFIQKVAVMNDEKQYWFFEKEFFKGGAD